MAEYKTIKGFKTQSYATDPVAATAAWSSGGALNTAREKLCEGGCGAQDTAFIAGGNTTEDKTEQYDGTSWTQAPVLNSGRNSGGMTGTPASALFFGGQPGNQDITEYFNGSAWSETADLNTGRLRVGSAGTSAPATLAYGGGPPYQSVCEVWNGTSWTEVNNIITAKIMFGCGSSTAAIGAGGEIPASPWRTANTESWDGTCWTETNNLNTAVNFNGMAGTQTAALSFGGTSPSVTAATELWNGTSWSNQNDMAVARSEMAPAGNATLALGTGGSTTAVTTTEEWADYSSTNPAPSLTMLNEGQIWYNTTGNALKYTAIAAGTWAAAPSINTTRAFGGGLGIQTAGMFVGGSGGASSGNETETYDGTSWTTKNTINTTRNRMGVATQSPNTASLIFGGSNPNTAPGYKNQTETFDGTSWTTAPATLNTSRREFGGSAGASNSAALGFSGYTTTYIKNVEEYNGSTWAEENDVNTARGVGGGGGTSADALFVAGLSPSFSAATETWNGTSWTSGNNANNARSYFGSGVTSSTSGLIGAGDDGSSDNKTEIWDGTSWTEVANTTTGMEGNKGFGTSSLAVVMGGYDPVGSYLSATESWDATVKTVKTVTVS